MAPGIWNQIFNQGLINIKTMGNATPESNYEGIPLVSNMYIKKDGNDYSSQNVKPGDVINIGVNIEEYGEQDTAITWSFSDDNGSVGPTLDGVNGFTVTETIPGEYTGVREFTISVGGVEDFTNYYATCTVSNGYGTIDAWFGDEETTTLSFLTRDI
jgi:hypothetical protein